MLPSFKNINAQRRSTHHAWLACTHQTAAFDRRRQNVTWLVVRSITILLILLLRSDQALKSILETCADLQSFSVRLKDVGNSSYSIISTKLTELHIHEPSNALMNKASLYSARKNVLTKHADLSVLHIIASTRLCTLVGAARCPTLASVTEHAAS